MRAEFGKMILKFMWKNKCSTVVKETKKKQTSDKRYVSQGPVSTPMTHLKSNSKESAAQMIHGYGQSGGAYLPPLTKAGRR